MVIFLLQIIIFQDTFSPTDNSFWYFQYAMA